MAYHDFKPDNLYAPVCLHEIISIIKSMVASLDLIFEGADISNAYLHGYFDEQLIMELPTASTGVLEKFNHAAKVTKSL